MAHVSHIHVQTGQEQTKKMQHNACSCETATCYSCAAWLCDFVCNLCVLSWICRRFAVLRDPAGWLSVNPVKGTVNTTGTLDRESPHVHNNRYSAVFMATDNGKNVTLCCTITLTAFWTLAI